ncbi:PREDICTED: putative nuclease HARBI1 [Diuraphis noxia]|uniref:putative nuclease HARBI1 n=1 Tax=Diuraphis noxia TaxID=143948 RepID=UPI00076360F0|nr:PREDICTED: putative nuclease HARBI1 [Diuraphis noxia]
MPISANEQRAIQLGFYRMRGFPRVIGAIDCSYIRIQSPNSDIGEQFRNKKGYFSINVQAVCSSDIVITNLVARQWAGSVHDSTIFDTSMLRAQFENKEFGACVLLGDGGYPCLSYLLTPLLNPRSESEKRYQKLSRILS